MEANVVDTVNLGGAAGLDFSVWAMFLRADIIVKFVVLALLSASIWCWAIIFDKIITLRRLHARAADFEASFWSGGSLEDLYDRVSERPRDPMSSVFVAAMREWRRAAAKGHIEGVGLTDRIERVMQITVSREMERAERYMTFLASTGSTAPFVGLFGTVWGIMNSFQAIALSKNTSLTVVAPGIAEALFATALGLLAAIPAVLAYNKLSRDLDRFAGRLEGFAGEFSAIISRQIEDN